MLKRFGDSHAARIAVTRSISASISFSRALDAMRASRERVAKYSFWWTRRRATRSKNCLEFISVVAFKVVKAFGASPVAGLYFSPSAVDGDVGSFLGGFEDERKLVFVFQIGGTEVA